MSNIYKEIETCVRHKLSINLTIEIEVVKPQARDQWYKSKKILNEFALWTLQILKNTSIAFCPNSWQQTSGDHVPDKRRMFPKPIPPSN